MFHVLDHNDIVYSGDLSQSTQYVLEHYGARFDEAIRTGIRILYSDPSHSLNEARLSLRGDAKPAGIKNTAGCPVPTQDG